MGIHLHVTHNLFINVSFRIYTYYILYKVFGNVLVY